MSRVQIVTTLIGGTQALLGENPRDLADAYQRGPRYPGLTGRQVQALQSRLESDTGFARRPNGELQATCATS